MDRSVRPAAITTASRVPTSPCRTFLLATRLTAAAVSITSSSSSSSLPPSVRRTTMARTAARASLQTPQAPWQAARRRRTRRRPRRCRYTSTRAWVRRRATPTPLVAAAAVEVRVRRGDLGGTGVTIRAPARADTRTSKRRRPRRRRGSRSTRSPSRSGRGGARTALPGPAARPRERCRPGESDPSVAGGHPPSCLSSTTTRAARAPARVRTTFLTNCHSGEPTAACGYRT